jgi:signal transduction histidine kinase
MSNHPRPRLSSLSLQWRVGALVLGALLVLFGLFGLLGSQLAHDNTRGMAAERLSVARLTAQLLDRQFEEQFRELEWIADGLSASEPGVPAPADLLRPSEFLITSLTLVDATGHVTWSLPADNDRPGADLSGELFVRTPLDSNERYASGVLPGPRGPRGPEPRVVFAVPVHGAQGTPVGVLVARIDATEAFSGVLLAAAQELGSSGHAELVDQNMRLIGSSEPGHALGPAEHPSFYTPLLASHASDVGLTDPIGDEDPGDRGQRHVMAFVPLSSVPWGLGLGGNESVFTAMADRWRGETLLLGLVGLVIAVFLMWMTRRTVVRPLRALTATSLRIAGGDLDTPVPALGDGEVRVLAQTLDEMRGRLRQVQADEERLSRLKDEFLATASHELRSPVAALAMANQLWVARLRRGQAVDPETAFTDMQAHVARLQALVGRLLDISRIEAGKMELERSPTDLSALAGDIVHLARLNAPGKTLRLEAPTPTTALVDQLRIGQVLMNLIDNAIKFSPDGGAIEVEVAATPDDQVRLSVRDHGVGIPPQDRAHVFDRFYQARAGRAGGLGLGLYISQQIVALHGGHIAVEGPPDGGTRVVVTLPALSAGSGG